MKSVGLCAKNCAEIFFLCCAVGMPVLQTVCESPTKAKPFLRDEDPVQEQDLPREHKIALAISAGSVFVSAIAISAALYCFAQLSGALHRATEAETQVQKLGAENVALQHKVAQLEEFIQTTFKPLNELLAPFVLDIVLRKK